MTERDDERAAAFEGYQRWLEEALGLAPVGEHKRTHSLAIAAALPAQAALGSRPGL